MSWNAVWLAVFVLAFGAFSLISLLIAVRGVAEIRELFTALDQEKRRKTPRHD
jgi:hypothetical protein